MTWLYVTITLLFTLQKLYEEASQVASDAVGSIRTVASFCAEKKVMELYQKKCEEPIRTGIRRGIISGIGYGVSFFMLYAVYACSFYAGARLVEDGKTTFSDVFRVSYFTYRTLSPSKNFHHFLSSQLCC